MFTDLSRPPLSAAALRVGLRRDSALWTDITVVRSTGSTNTDLLEQADRGASEGTVLVAEYQRSGHGRHGRVWQSPPQAGIHVSFLLRPVTVDRARWGWIPLLAGVALVDALEPLAGIPLALKWPNDLLAGDPEGEGYGKAAGILVEVRGDAVVVGIGVNVSTTTAELPGPPATSLLLAGSRCTDRAPIVLALLRAVERRYRSWSTVDGGASSAELREEYRARCATLHRQVTVQLPGAVDYLGRAVDVDPAGSLVVRSADGERRSLAAGDVTHLR